jgi:hypothetical protein
MIFGNYPVIALYSRERKNFSITYTGDDKKQGVMHDKNIIILVEGFRAYLPRKMAKTSFC